MQLHISTTICHNLLKASVYLMYHQIQQQPFKAYRLRDAPTSLTFNNCTLCPYCIYVFPVYLSDMCHLQHKLIGFYNRYENCLQRGTDWA
jgi:ferredoxin